MKAIIKKENGSSSSSTAARFGFDNAEDAELIKLMLVDPDTGKPIIPHVVIKPTEDGN